MLYSLDEANKAGLAHALARIILNRQRQHNFQLVCITHDEVSGLIGVILFIVYFLLIIVYCFSCFLFLSFSHLHFALFFLLISLPSYHPSFDFSSKMGLLIWSLLSCLLFSFLYVIRLKFPILFTSSLLFSFLYPSFPFFSLIIMCVCVCSRISFDWSVRSFQGTYARTIIHPYLLVITYRTSYLFLFWCFTLLLLKGFYSFFFYI